MHVIVTDGTDGWHRATVPGKGSVILFPDGLLNILDSNGRCWTIDHGIKRVELYDGPYDEGDFDKPKPTP